MVDGRSFENYDDYPPGGLGRIPLRSALANSCNTAFIGASTGGWATTDLADAAATLGLGIDHDLGFPAYFGQVPPPETETEAAADLIGQGTVLASPMVMATVMASIQAGRTVVPRLLEQVDVAVPDAAPPLARAEADALRSMLRTVVTSGSGSRPARRPRAAGHRQDGHRRVRPRRQALLHAWMVAAQGDLAVAVYVDIGQSGSRTAGPILEAFLRAAGVRAADCVRCGGRVGRGAARLDSDGRSRHSTVTQIRHSTARACTQRCSRTSTFRATSSGIGS